MNEMSVEQLESRAAEIDAMNLAEMTDADASTALADERDAIAAELESRKQKAAEEAEIREQVANDNTLEVVKTFGEERNEKVMTEIEMRESREYRNAWLNNLRGIQLSDAEQRAFAVAGSPVPVQTANDIMKVAKDKAPILEKLTVIYAANSVTYYVEGTVNDAVNHTEGAALTASNDTLTKITLTPSEIAKQIYISESVKTMSVDAFERWLAYNIGNAIAEKMSAAIVAAILPSTAAATSYTAANVQALLGSVKGNVTVLCNRKTLFTQLLPLQDNAKNAMVRFEGGAATLYGCPVLVDDAVADGVTIAGDLSKAVAVVAEDVNIYQTFDATKVSHVYTGVALFDVKAGLASAFAKIATA